MTNEITVEAAASIQDDIHYLLSPVLTHAVDYAHLTAAILSTAGIKVVNLRD